MNKKLILTLLVAVLSAATVCLVMSREISLKQLKQLRKPIKKACYTHDGIGVNKKHPIWGSAGEAFPRLTTPRYTDNVRSPARADGNSTRLISDEFFKQDTCDETNTPGLSSMFFSFAQFIDHDVDSIGTGINTEAFNIPIPQLPGQFQRFVRANFFSGKQIFINQHLDQVNTITGYMDCSQIYGSDPIKARALRDLKGGLLKTDVKFGLEFLPKAFAQDGKFFSGGRSGSIIAGDDRVTESLPITVLQTLFLREHNRLARLLAKRFKICKADQKQSKYDEWLYQSARSINCAQIQSITYKEFVPAMLGKDKAINPNKIKYDPEVQVTPSTEFATVAYRFGHSLVSCDLKKVNDKGKVVETIEFRNAFNNFGSLQDSKDAVDLLLRGLCTQAQQNLDEKVVNGLRVNLFNGTSTDLAAINMQRSRDCGIGSYNQLRGDLKLPLVDAFQITKEKEKRDKLVKFFGKELAGMEPFLGVLMEPKDGKSLLGTLGTKIVRGQFVKFVAGDPCFYTHHKNSGWVKDLKKAIENVTLADIIAANTDIRRKDPSLKISAFKSKPFK